MRTRLPAILVAPPRAMCRAAAALMGAVVAGTLLATVLGLGTSTFLGAADNGDGARLYCGAGLMPATPDRASNWKGSVVTGFTTGQRPCPDPVVTSALPILRLATVGSGDGIWSLSRLGLLYVALLMAVTGVAVWAACAAGLARGLIVLPAPAALAQPEYLRFLVSAFSEPAGLLGAYTLLSGIAALAVTRPTDRAARLVALGLTATGGLLAVTAKTSYAPLLLVALMACAVVRVQLGRRVPGRAVGVSVAAAAVLLSLAPVSAALAWQERTYGPVNVHNVVWTLVLPELGPEATGRLGLPPEAAARSGEGYYVRYAEGIPGWRETVGARPDETRMTAYRLLAAHPAAVLDAVGIALRATRGAELDYLPALPLGLPAQVYPPPAAVYPDDFPVGAQGADTARFSAWLDELTLPWLPAVLTGLGLTAGTAAALLRRSRPGALPGTTACAVLAGTAAVSSLGLATLAVLGDGYNELPKHVWLAAYTVDVTALALAGAVVCVLIGVLTRGGRCPRHAPGPGQACGAPRAGSLGAPLGRSRARSRAPDTTSTTSGPAT